MEDIKSGKKFTFDLNPHPGNKYRTSLPNKEILKKIKKGDKIFIDDIIDINIE